MTIVKSNKIGKEEEKEEDSYFYVFGYGSLIWKFPYNYKEKMEGIVLGYVRRFWQLSTDHRGTVENKGRVVTMVPFSIAKQYETNLMEKNAKVKGMLYKIHKKDQEEILASLDFREKQGYETYTINVHNSEGQIIVKEALVYVASETNEYFHAELNLNKIAETILKSKGPSGQNLEYFKQLKECIKEEDDYLNELEKQIHSITSE